MEDEQSNYVYNVQRFMKTPAPLSGPFDADSLAEFSLLLVKLFPSCLSTDVLYHLIVMLGVCAVL